MGVMNGLQRDLREKILVGSPDIRVLTFGDDMMMTTGSRCSTKVKAAPGVVAAAPFVHHAGRWSSAGHSTPRARYVVGHPAGRARRPRRHRHPPARRSSGDFRFASSDGQQRGVVLGKRLASRLNVYPGDKVTLVSPVGERR